MGQDVKLAGIADTSLQGSLKSCGVEIRVEGSIIGLEHVTGGVELQENRLQCATPATVLLLHLNFVQIEMDLGRQNFVA